MVSFSVTNNLGSPSSQLQINFGVQQNDTENSATGFYRSCTVDVQSMFTFLEFNHDFLGRDNAVRSFVYIFPAVSV